jgi:hypothetical protein
MALYSRYGDLLSGDTVSITAGSEDADFPKENITDFLSRTVGKFTGATGTYRRTFGAPVAPEAAIFLNTNATAIQLTNGAGLNEAVTIPSTPEDDLRLDPWIDLRGLPNGSSTTWNAALTAGSAAALGEFILVSSLRSLDVLFTPSPTEEESHPVIHHETDADVDLFYGIGVRTRRGTLSTRGVSGRATFLSLQRAQRGRLRPWIFIPNEALNDALFVHLESSPMRLTPIAFGASDFSTYLTDVSISVKEQQKGIL